MKKAVPPGYVAMEQAVFQLLEARYPNAWNGISEHERTDFKDALMNGRRRSLAPRMLRRELSKTASAAPASFTITPRGPCQNRGPLQIDEVCSSIGTSTQALRLDLQGMQERILGAPIAAVKSEEAEIELREEVGIESDALARCYFCYLALCRDLKDAFLEGSMRAWSFDDTSRFLDLPPDIWAKRHAAETILETGGLVMMGNERSNRSQVVCFIDDIVELKISFAKAAAKETGSPGRNKKVAREFLQGSHVIGRPWAGVKKTWEAVRKIPECRNLSRDTVEDLMREIDPAGMRRRGRPRQNPED